MDPLFSNISQGCNQDVSWGCSSLWRLERRIPFLRLLAGFSSLWALSVRASAPCWPSAGGQLQSLARWGSPYFNLFGQSQQGRVCWQDGSYILYTAILWVESLHLSCILLIKSRSGILSTLKGRILHIAVTARSWDDWGYVGLSLLQGSLWFVSRVREEERMAHAVISKEVALTHISHDGGIFGHFCALIMFVFFCI